MKYFLDVTIRPGEHYIHVRGRIAGAAENLFYLNENFTMLGASAEKCRFDRSRPHPEYDTVSRPLLFEPDHRDFEFEYEGFIPTIIDDVNQIDEDAVELACYAGWYPKPKRFGEFFEFEIRLSLPSGYEVMSNGAMKSGNTILSVGPEDDIAIFASRKVCRCHYENDRVAVSTLCPEDMLADMESRAKDIAAANDFYTMKYGPLQRGKGKVEILSVFRPRGGWAYKRGNVSFLSADQSRGIRQYRMDFHELAHGWWCIADMESSDWINEGCAEFSAYSAAKHIYGKESAGKYLDKYLADIDRCSGTASIAETKSTSPDKYTNFYEKTVVMLLNAQLLFGENRIFDLLKELFQKFNETKGAATKDFLALCGAEMRAYFEKCLYSSGWQGIDYKSRLQECRSF